MHNTTQHLPHTCTALKRSSHKQAKRKREHEKAYLVGEMQKANAPRLEKAQSGEKQNALYSYRMASNAYWQVPAMQTLCLVHTLLASSAKSQHFASAASRPYQYAANQRKNALQHAWPAAALARQAAPLATLRLAACCR
jgi:hypothetical protein